MIIGDLDLDRAFRDPRYRARALRFLEGPRGAPPASEPSLPEPPACPGMQHRDDGRRLRAVPPHRRVHNG